MHKHHLAWRGTSFVQNMPKDNRRSVPILQFVVTILLSYWNAKLHSYLPKLSLAVIFLHLRQGLKNKIIEGKGIEQLWNAIQTLGHTNKKKRRKVEGIDISQIKKIYPGSSPS